MTRESTHTRARVRALNYARKRQQTVRNICTHRETQDTSTNSTGICNINKRINERTKDKHRNNKETN